MSTRLPSTTKSTLSKVFASVLTVCSFCAGSVSQANLVKYDRLPKSAQEKIEEANHHLSEKDCKIDYSDGMSYSNGVVIAGVCKSNFSGSSPLWGYDHLDLNVLKSKVSNITLNVGKAEFDRYAVGSNSRYPELNTLYLHSALLPTVYFDGKVYKELMGGNTLSIAEGATVVGQNTNDFLQQTRFNRPLVAVEAHSSSIESKGTTRASEDMLEVPAEKFQMFELNDFYSFKLYDSKLENRGVIQGTIFANNSDIHNSKEIYGSPKDGTLVALTAQHSSIQGYGNIYGDLVFNGPSVQDIYWDGIVLSYHVGNVYLNGAAHSLYVSGRTRLNGEVYAADYATVYVERFKRPTKQVKVPTVKPQPLLETYREFEQAKTNVGTYSKYYLSNLAPADKKNLPGKVTKTKNPTGTLFIGGVISLNDLSLDTSDDAIFYGVQKISAAYGGLVVYGLPEKSVGTYLIAELSHSYKIYFGDLGTCAVQGVLYDYDRLKQMHALKSAGKLEINTDCYGTFERYVVPENLRDILVKKKP